MRKRFGATEAAGPDRKAVLDVSSRQGLILGSDSD